MRTVLSSEGLNPCATFLVLLLFPGALLAQPAETTARAGSTAAEVSFNYVAFYDDAVIDHQGVAGGMRVHLTPRLSVGPELAYLIGPRDDRDVVLTGNLTIDFRKPRIGVAGRVEPYAVVGAGILSHTSNNWTGVSPFVAWGGGARVWLGRKVYAASDVRLGFSPHIRVSGTIGIVGL
jgi:hypothetical protein